ncbi:MAG: hypothetical protein ACF8MF_04875 [Phycisphaerales bacterium JB052]
MTTLTDASSEHPLAEAIVKGLESRTDQKLEASDFESVTGKGIVAIVDGARVRDRSGRRCSWPTRASTRRPSRTRRRAPPHRRYVHVRRRRWLTCRSPHGR